MTTFIVIVVIIIFIIIIKLTEKSKSGQINTSNYSRNKEMEHVLDDTVKKNIINNDIRIVNESEIIIEKTNNPDTKISRCVDMLEAMKRLKKYQNSGFVKINNLEEMSETYNNLLYELKSKKEINLNKEKALDDLERPRRNYNNQRTTEEPLGRKYKRLIKESNMNEENNLKLFLKELDQPGESHTLQKLQKHNEEISKILMIAADRNNRGIKYEKQGKIEKAVELYEMNIKDEFVCTHPYNRLMIIYRRRKEYNDEIRIINNFLSIIVDFRGDDKQKYLKRLEKAKKLLENQNK